MSYWTSREKATDQERRDLVRQFVEKKELDPDARDVELQLRLPGNRPRHMAAAARIALIGTVLSRYARIRLRCIGGKGRRAATVMEVARE